MLVLSKFRYYNHVPLVSYPISLYPEHLFAITDCTKHIEVTSKMYLVQFINPVDSYMVSGICPTFWRRYPARTVNDIFLFLESFDREAEERRFILTIFQLGN